MEAGKKLRTYLDDVPEHIKEQLSKAWGERKTDTYPAARKHGIRIYQGDSFNRALTFELGHGYYHLVSDVVSTDDISSGHSDVGVLCAGLVDRMAAAERKMGCVPLFASNVCDWDSGYAAEVGANVRLRDSIVDACIRNNIVITGGETANLGDQVRQRGMSWMFTLLSRYGGTLGGQIMHAGNSMDSALYDTFDCVTDVKSFEIVHGNGMSLLHVKKKSMFLMTADGAGSKSIVCYQARKMADIEDALAMCCDDATREGAFPVIASIGIHAEDSGIRAQIIDYMRNAGRMHMIPLMGCVFHESGDVSTYIMNGVALSEVRKVTGTGEKVMTPGLDLVLLYEEQRANGITTQRKVFSETFGEEWYRVNASDAFKSLNDRLQGKYSMLTFSDEKRTLGELVARPSTPYFRIDSAMPEEILGKIRFRINISSGGVIGKTKRLLEPFGMGAYYFDVFEAPKLILLLQMASQVEGSKGVISDEVAYSTWGCGNGAVIGTTDPRPIRDYYVSNGIPAKIGGVVTSRPEISIASRCLDSTLKKQPHILVHRYIDKPLG